MFAPNPNGAIKKIGGSLQPHKDSNQADFSNTIGDQQTVVLLLGGSPISSKYKTQNVGRILFVTYL